MFYDMTAKFMSNKIVIRLSDKQFSVADIPFPSISFCPEISFFEFDLIELLEKNETLTKPE